MTKDIPFLLHPYGAQSAQTQRSLQTSGSQDYSYPESTRCQPCQGPGLSVLTSPATKNSRGASSSLALYLAMIFSAIGWISCLAASDSPSSSESVTREERTRNSGLSTSGTWDDPRAGPGPHWAHRHRQALGTGPSPPASTQVELSQSYPGSCAAPTPSPEPLVAFLPVPEGEP